jgi:hypothetical protein
MAATINMIAEGTIADQNNYLLDAVVLTIRLNIIS